MKSSLARNSATGLAIVVTAVLANALGGVAAQAEENPDGSGAAPAAEPTDVITTGTPETTETITVPTETTTSPTPPLPNGRATTSGPAATTSAPAEEVEPDYGSQKFRVGVRAADGTTSTVGSKLEITISGSVDPSQDEVETCTTVAAVAPRDDNASFCPSDALILPPFARAGSVDTTREFYFTEGVRSAPAGATVTVRQISTPPDSGLAITETNGSVQPCTGTVFGPLTPCVIDNENQPEGVYSTVMFVNEPSAVEPPVVTPPVVDPGTGTDPDDDVSGDGVTTDDASTTDDALPDTGAPAGPGSSAPLIGALLVASGAAVVAGGVSRPAHGRRRR